LKPWGKGRRRTGAGGDNGRKWRRIKPTDASNDAGTPARLRALWREFDPKDELHHAASAIIAAISRFTRCTVPLPHPNIFATLRMPLAAPSCSRFHHPQVPGDTLVGTPTMRPHLRTLSVNRDTVAATHPIRWSAWTGLPVKSSALIRSTRRIEPDQQRVRNAGSLCLRNERASDARSMLMWNPDGYHCHGPLWLSLRRVSDVAGQPHRSSLRPAKSRLQSEYRAIRCQGSSTTPCRGSVL
jgi:hypothetical protein